MSLSMREVINAQIMPQAATAQRRDMSMVAIFTSELGLPFANNVKDRYVLIDSADGAADLFGSGSAAYKAAQALFSARPRLRKALIARWNREPLNIQDSANALQGGERVFNADDFNNITDGSMMISVGNKKVFVQNIDLSKVAKTADVIDALKKALPKELTAEAIAAGNSKFRVTIKAATTGQDDSTTLGYAFDGSGGTYVGKLFKLEKGQATITVGQNGASLAIEKPTDALHKLQDVYQDWYGAYFADVLTDDNLEDAVNWIVASDLKVMSYTALRDEQIEWDDKNVLKRLSDKKSGRLMVQFNKTGDDHAGATILAIAVSTNWNGQNTAKTVKFKQEPNVRSDELITVTQATKCRRLGINFYTDYDRVPMLAEGVMLGGTFIDETVGLDAFLDACQKQAFTTLQATPSKIPQTDKGQARLMGSLMVIGDEFKRNGFLAGGIWNGEDVGDLIVGDRLDEGFYFYSDSFDTQATADREVRKMMPIMCAIKLAGAGHSADILISFNR